ncbi:MAG: ParM/StbA family protein [Parafilimonas sp.]
MQHNVITFPSVFETAYGNTQNAAKDLLNGLKIKKNETWYLVGNMARRNAINAGRVVNAAPDEEDFDILFRAAMVNVLSKVQQPFTVTVGLPLSTYNVYKHAAGQHLSRRHFMIEHDTATFNVNGGVKKNTFEVDAYDVIPEIVGGIIGLKKVHAPDLTKNFIAISFGFGTVEGGFATNDGLVHRTCFSSHGIRYVTNNLARELNTQYFLDMKNEHQMDEAFLNGSLFTNRRRIDLKELKRTLLEQYYREVISPLIRKHFADSDLEHCSKIYLMGGGANYRELTDLVAEEFKDFIPVEVVPNPETVASLGYLYNSLRVSDNNPARCIGLDLGNATTSVSIFEQG